MSMNAENREKILEMYWGENGIGYSVGRVPMDSCDFSVKVLTCLILISISKIIFQYMLVVLQF